MYPLGSAPTCVPPYRGWTPYRGWSRASRQRGEHTAWSRASLEQRLAVRACKEEVLRLKSDFAKTRNYLEEGQMELSTSGFLEPLEKPSGYDGEPFFEFFHIQNSP